MGKKSDRWVSRGYGLAIVSAALCVVGIVLTVFATQPQLVETGGVMRKTGGGSPMGLIGIALTAGSAVVALLSFALARRRAKAIRVA